MCVRTFISFSTFDSCRRQFCSRFAPYFTPTASTVVSGYGFLTFQNQTDADRILSAEHFIGRGGKQVRERRKKTSEKFAVRRSAVQYTVRRKGVSLRSWSLKESCEERKGSQGGYTAIHLLMSSLGPSSSYLHAGATLVLFVAPLSGAGRHSQGCIKSGDEQEGGGESLAGGEAQTWE